METGSKVRGNLNIIGDPHILPTAKRRIPTSPSSEKVVVKQFMDDKCKMLLGIFNKELNDVFENFDVDIRADRNQPVVTILSDASRKPECERGVKKLEELLAGVESETITCNSSDYPKCKEDILKVLPRVVGIACIPSQKKEDIIRIYAKDRSTLVRALTQLKDSSVRTPLSTSSRKDRSFSKTNDDKDNTHSSQATEWSSGHPTIKQTFTTSNGLIVKIYKGAITRLNVDAVVNAANEHLANGAGVAGALSKAGGYEFDTECQDFIRNNGNIPVTKNVVTGAGAMKYRGVIHAVGPQWYSYSDKGECVRKVRDTVMEILDTAVFHGYRTIAMPPISSGLFGVPVDLCAAMYVLGIVQFCKTCRNIRQLKEFHIIDIKDEILDLVIDFYEKWKDKPSSLDPDLLVQRHPKATKGSKHNTDAWLSNKDNWRGQGQGESLGYGKRRGHDYYNTHGSEPSRPMTGGSPHSGQSPNIQGGSRPYTYRPTCVFDPNTVTYTFQGKLQVFVYNRDILHCRVDAIVAAENRKFDRSGAISRAIKEAVGPQYGQAFKDFVFGKHENLKLGQVLMGQPGKLSLRCIYHVIMEQFSPHVTPTDRQLLYLRTSVHNVLAMANNLDPNAKKLKSRGKEYKPLHKIAMAIPGAGALTTPLYVEKCCEAMFDTIDDFTRWTKSMVLKEVHIVDVRQDIIAIIHKTFKERVHRQYQRALPPMPSRPEMASGIYANDLPMGVQRKTGNQHVFNPKKFQKIEQWYVVRNRSSSFRDMDQYMEPVKKGNMKILTDMSASNSSRLTSGGDTSQESTSCVICMDTFDKPVKLRKCGHMFCKECITESFKQKPVCPICSTVYTVIQGDQPVTGTADIYRDEKPLPGYNGGTFIIHYKFPDGKQEEDHPEPGQQFKGLDRQAYLPDTKPGRKVLGMLREAFTQRLIFTVGQSHTTGENNVVTWNDIHHKTRREGGPDRFGYPDNGYLDRVTDELGAKGIGI